MASPSVTFIVLALDEAAHIQNTVNTVVGAVQASDVADYQLVLVNDGSSDNTGELMEELGKAYRHIHVIHNQSNLGFGAAYLKGVSVAEKEYVMIIAGDNIMPATSITTIVNALGETDMVLPFMTDSRFREPVRRFGSWAFTETINIIFGCRINYYNGMVARRCLFSETSILSTGYMLQAECVIKFLNKNASYCEVGVPCGHLAAVKTSSKALRLKNLVNLFRDLAGLIRGLKHSSS